MRATACLGVLVVLATGATFGGATPAPQDRSPGRVALEGLVLTPDGSPVEGAVVVSSAGGKAVTDVAGRYRLDVEVPPDATSVQVTALGKAGGSLVASTNVLLNGATRSARVESLSLSLVTSCSPSWQPTFGGVPGTFGSTFALAVFDDGAGLALYVGGTFGVVAGLTANRIARWDGSSWSAL